MTNTPTNSINLGAVKKLLALLREDYARLGIAFLTVIITTSLNLLIPYLFGRAVDTSVQAHDYHGLFVTMGILLVAFTVASASQYAQMQLVGGVGQRVLFRLRNKIFTKLQQLPIAFFGRQKAGDLISRINSDTDKLNQFFAETLTRFVGGLFMIVGSGVFIVMIQMHLGFVAMIPAMFLLVFTQLVSPWVKKRTAASLASTGALSGEVQESLENFKVIAAFNRRDYFVERFEKANQENYGASVKAGMASGLFTPVYEGLSVLSQMLVVGYGVYLIQQGQLTLGLLLSFLLYVERFYMPLRQIATLWTGLQQALAGWDRVSTILENSEELAVIPSEQKKESSVLAFHGVNFRYTEGKDVLHQANFSLDAGKTYALVGPTGGGKTTTASLMARLYDPTEGVITMHGKDLRSYTAEERTEKVGFILQEPFLFTGTLLENMFYGNRAYTNKTDAERIAALHEAGLDGLLARFEKGSEAALTAQVKDLSLGQRQLVAFMRAVLRRPDILILDEATANIDTVTEQLLEETLQKLPAHTTKVIIAHRLNTIQNADEIFFVNGGEITAAGSFEKALDLLMHGKRQS